MNTDRWNHYYKVHHTRLTPSKSNMLYTPLVNQEGTIMCMDWSLDSEYQKEHTNRTQELLDFFFQREVKYFTVFKDYKWAPKLLDISGNKIFLEWNTKTLSDIIFIDKVDPGNNWKEQIYSILKDITDAGYYKMALYPHCFFLDKAGIVKTFDFYGCVEINNPYVERKHVEGLIGPDSHYRFDRATENNLINFESFFKHTLQTHLGTIWPDNPFPTIYERLFNET